jgi:hypothetical protein
VHPARGVELFHFKTDGNPSAATLLAAGVGKIASAIPHLLCGGWTKLRNREIHTAEHAAGIIILIADTFLLRNTIFYAVDEVLCRTLQTDNGEQTQRNQQLVPFIAIHQVRPDGAANMLRNFFHTAATAASAPGLHDLGIQHQRIHRFQNSDRQVGGSGAFSAAGHRAEGGAGSVALEHTDVPLTAKQHHFLFHRTNTAEFLDISGCYACLTADLAVDTDTDLIESPIERNCIDIHIRPQHVGAFDTDRAGVIDNLLTVLRQIHTDILVAIFVTTGIQNTVCIDTHHFFSVRRTHSVFSHETFTSVII